MSIFLFIWFLIYYFQQFFFQCNIKGNISELTLPFSTLPALGHFSKFIQIIKKMFNEKCSTSSHLKTPSFSIFRSNTCIFKTYRFKNEISYEVTTFTFSLEEKKSDTILEYIHITIHMRVERCFRIYRKNFY